MARIVTFGEAMIRLAPPHHQRIEQARSFDIEIGGAELNCGVGLARLGHTVEWVSVVPNNSLGRLIRNRVREAGVDVRHVQFSDLGRCGVNFFEIGSAPRASEVLYDRAGSSVSLMSPETFDWKAILKDADWFHVTGITPALSANAAAATSAALNMAKSLGVKSSFDLNYRSKLWSPGAAARALESLIPQIDLLIASVGDAEQLFDIIGANFTEVTNQLMARFHLQTVACLRRENADIQTERISAVCNRGGLLLESKWYDINTIDRIGSGDAFAAGMIDGLLQSQIQIGLETGAAFAAIKQTIPGDLPLSNREEIEAVMAGNSLRVKR